MDLWVVAAATGAGYIAKYLQSSAEEREELLDSSSQKRDQSWAFCRIGQRKGSRLGDIFPKRDDDVTNRKDLGGKVESTDFLDDDGDVLRELETSQLIRNRLLRNRRARGFSTKERILKKGYIFSPPPSPSTPFAGPLLVNQVIDIDIRDSFLESGNNEDDGLCLEEKNECLGSLISRQSGIVELPRTRKSKVGKGQMSTDSSSGTFLSQGPLNGMVLFFAGITIGIISSQTANKRELDNISTKLKENENLVRDLHEEIEMRDKSDLEELTKCSTSKELDDESVDKHEFMSKIEAELEAELEKLELKITSSQLEELSDYFELDPNFEADFIQGNLEVHVARLADTNRLKFDNNADGTSTNHTQSPNYAVSPYELSLRLHEVIKSRLEARIEELEQALKDSKKRQSIEWLRIISSKGSENGEDGSCSTPQTQIYRYEVYDVDQPLDISLSGEALDIYDEAYEEVMRIADSDEDVN